VATRLPGSYAPANVGTTGALPAWFRGAGHVASGGGAAVGLVARNEGRILSPRDLPFGEHVLYGAGE
jgi:hypothetical protein